MSWGSNGTNGKSTGDVGFIYKLTTKFNKATENLPNQGHYIGFNELETSRRFICRAKEKPSGDDINKKLYVLLADKAFPNQYAVNDVDLPSEKRGYATINAYGLGKRKRKNLEAAKKTVITRQNLNIHFAEIANRQRFSEILQMLLFFQEQEQSNTDALVSQIETEQVILHRLSSLQRIKENKVVQRRYIKSSIPVRKKSQKNRKCAINRRFADDGKCFELLPTADGPDNILHCIFGKMDRSSGSYICSNTKAHRKYLSTCLMRDLKTRKDDTLNVASFLKSFVERMNVDADQHRYPVACRMLKDKDFGDIDTWDPMQNEESLQLLNEYATFIEFPSNILDIVELEILAITHRKIIYIYEEQEESLLKPSLKKISNKKGGEHQPALESEFIFYNKLSACWQRLEIVRKLQPFCDEIMESDSQSKQLLAGHSNFVHTQENEFQLLLSLVKRLEINPNSDIEMSIKKLALIPTNKIVAKFLKPIFENIPNAMELLSDINFLIERIMDENIDPIIYLYIIENYKPQEWKYEFLLLQLEERLVDGVFSKIYL